MLFKFLIKKMYAAETNGDQGHANIEEGISEEVAQKLQEKSSVLTQIRKQKGKKLPEDLATIEEIKSYHCLGSHTVGLIILQEFLDIYYIIKSYVVSQGLHSASTTGITALDVKVNEPNKIVTGGNDKTAVVFNKATEQIVATFKGHTKKVTSVIYHPDEVNHPYPSCLFE